MSVLPIEFGGVTHVMGVINLSVDSKNIHTVARSVDEAVAMAGRYRDWGATLIDLGGQSSHYDNPTIDAADEISLVVPAIEALVAEDHLVAIDTWKPEVAEAAVRAGAKIVNDTGGLKDRRMIEVVAGHGVVPVVVYIEGDNPHAVGDLEIVPDKAKRTAQVLADKLEELADQGIDEVIVDPGIAINYRGDYQSYTKMQLEVIADTRSLRQLAHPVLIPIPRKRETHRVAAYIALALEHGADIIRVHDVAMACDLVRLFGRTPQLS